MKRPVLQPLLAWAIRDLMRRPLESGLLVTALLLTVSVTAAPLLFAQALSNHHRPYVQRMLRLWWSGN